MYVQMVDICRSQKTKVPKMLDIQKSKVPKFQSFKVWKVFQNSKQTKKPKSPLREHSKKEFQSSKNPNIGDPLF